MTIFNMRDEAFEFDKRPAVIFLWSTQPNLNTMTAKTWSKPNHLHFSIKNKPNKNWELIWPTDDSFKGTMLSQSAFYFIPPTATPHRLPLPPTLCKLLESFNGPCSYLIIPLFFSNKSLSLIFLHAAWLDTGHMSRFLKLNYSANKLNKIRNVLNTEIKFEWM